MKKFFAVALAALTLFALFCGCGKKAQSFPAPIAQLNERGARIEVKRISNRQSGDIKLNVEYPLSEKQAKLLYKVMASFEYTELPYSYTSEGQLYTTDYVVEIVVPDGVVNDRDVLDLRHFSIWSDRYLLTTENGQQKKYRIEDEDCVERINAVLDMGLGESVKLEKLTGSVSCSLRASNGATAHPALTDDQIEAINDLLKKAGAVRAQWAYETYEGMTFIQIGYAPTVVGDTNYSRQFLINTDGYIWTTCGVFKADPSLYTALLNVINGK